MSKKRLVAAGLFLAVGLDLAVVTATVMRGKGIDAMQTARQASLLTAIGFALLAPLLVSLESLVLLVTGVVFGSVAALFTVLPYSLARTDSILPDTGIAIYLAVVGAATILTLAASLGAARRAIRTPAIEAVGR
jgi:hypothetical protein